MDTVVAATASLIASSLITRPLNASRLRGVIVGRRVVCDWRLSATCSARLASARQESPRASKITRGMRQLLGAELCQARVLSPPRCLGQGGDELAAYDQLCS